MERLEEPIRQVSQAEEAGASEFPEFSVSPGRTEEVRVVEGVVEHGRHLGRELGFPTANLPVGDSFPLPDGVYRSRVEVFGRSYDAMSNLGCNPSVGGVSRRLETHLFGFTGELYGVRLRVELLDRIRGERRFTSVSALREQIARDKIAIMELINR